mmetsp:Transcript_61108/g.177171  ORF Transcript_61108/g.177171 Transcript_61108/m.177171 type:complete len:204 (-) Transcript_61108:1100-1711(-)
MDSARAARSCRRWAWRRVACLLGRVEASGWCEIGVARGSKAGLHCFVVLQALGRANRFGRAVGPERYAPPSHHVEVLLRRRLARCFLGARGARCRCAARRQGVSKASGGRHIALPADRLVAHRLPLVAVPRRRCCRWRARLVLAGLRRGAVGRRAPPERRTGVHRVRPARGLAAQPGRRRHRLQHPDPRRPRGQLRGGRFSRG